LVVTRKPDANHLRKILLKKANQGFFRMYNSTKKAPEGYDPCLLYKGHIRNGAFLHESKLILD